MHSHEHLLVGVRCGVQLAAKIRENGKE